MSRLALLLLAALGIGAGYQSASAPTPYEVEPETGWSDMALRSMACEAAVRIIHDLPMSDVQRAAGLLRLTGRVDDPATLELLRVIQLGAGDRPLISPPFSPRGRLQERITIGEFDTFGHGR